MQIRAATGETIWEDSAIIIKLISAKDGTATVDVRPKPQFWATQHRTQQLALKSK